MGARGGPGTAKTTLPSHPIVTPTCHPAPPHLSSRTLLLSSRAKPRDLKRPLAQTALFTNALDHRRTGETRYPRGAGGARVRSIRAMPHRPSQSPDAIPSPTTVIPNPFTVIPSEAEGPETDVDTNTTVHEHSRPPSCRGNPVPTVGGGTGAATSHTPTTHPQPPGTTTTTVVPGTPGTHGARVGRYPNHEHARPPGAHPHTSHVLPAPDPAHHPLPRLPRLRSGTHPPTPC